LEELIPRLMPAFRRSTVFHFRPYVGQSKGHEGAIVSDPHSKKTRGILSSMAKLFYYSADYVVGYFLKVVPARVCSTFVVFDRYYDDLIVDPRRYRYGAPIFLLRIMRFFIPSPELIFCLDAPAEILQSRKQEVSFDETVRQRKAYRELVSSLRNGSVIDASQPLEDVVRDVETVVLNYMAERTKKRL